MKRFVGFVLALILGAFILNTNVSAADALDNHSALDGGFLNEVEVIADDKLSPWDSNSLRESRFSIKRAYGDDSQFWQRFRNDYYYNMLSDSQKALYDSMYSTCFSYLTSAGNIDTFDYYSSAYMETLSYFNYFPCSPMSSADAFLTVRVFLESNPQFYYVGGFSLLTGFDDSTGLVTKVSFNVYPEYKNGVYRFQKNAEIRSKLETWLTDINTKPTEYEKAKRIFEIVGDNVDYDPWVQGGFSLGEEHQSCATAILEGVSICAGYAEMYELLARGVGLDCVAVTSAEHEWNKVRIGDFWYNLDITWGDTGRKGSYYWSYYAKADSTVPFVDNVNNNGFHNLEAHLKRIAPSCPYDYENTGASPSYTITYSGISNGTYTYGNSITQLLVPTKKGYVFDGWYDNPSYSNEKIDFIPKYSTGNKVFYPKWSPAKYTLVFDKNGANKGSMSSLTLTYGSKKTLTKNKFTRTGYTFSGWNTQKNGSGKSYKDGASVSNLSSTNGATVNLYAQWIANKYNIKFYGNGATSGSLSTIKSRKYGKTYTLPTNKFKRYGYTFVGWSKSKTGKVAYKNKEQIKNLSSKNGATVKLYAKWVKSTKVYKIKYNLNGGKLKKKNPSSYTVTKKTFKLNNPTKKGYKFVGWYTKKSGGAEVTKVSKGSYGNITLYARWKKK